MTESRIAITDLETTGPDPFTHEIIEIGLVLIDSQGNILETWSVKTKPEHPETADPEGLAVNGYEPDLWKDAVPLADALRTYAAKTKGALFCAHNATVDWSFIATAFQRAGIVNTFDYHKIDTFSLAWQALRNNPPKTFRLKDIALHLGIAPEAEPHRALNGAMLAYQAYKALTEQSGE